MSNSLCQVEAIVKSETETDIDCYYFEYYFDYY